VTAAAEGAGLSYEKKGFGETQGIVETLKREKKHENRTENMSDVENARRRMTKGPYLPRGGTKTSSLEQSANKFKTMPAFTGKNRSDRLIRTPDSGEKRPL